MYRIDNITHFHPERMNFSFTRNECAELAFLLHRAAVNLAIDADDPFEIDAWELDNLAANFETASKYEEYDIAKNGGMYHLEYQGILQNNREHREKAVWPDCWHDSNGTCHREK